MKKAIEYLSPTLTAHAQVLHWKLADLTGTLAQVGFNTGKGRSNYGMCQDNEHIIQSGAWPEEATRKIEKMRRFFEF